MRIPEGKRSYALERVVLGRKMGGDRRQAIDVVVADISFLERYRASLAALDSADERAVYEQMGIPGKIDRMQLATHGEMTWWRFEHGAPCVVSELEPITPFEAYRGGAV